MTCPKAPTLLTAPLVSDFTFDRAPPTLRVPGAAKQRGAVQRAGAGANRSRGRSRQRPPSSQSHRALVGALLMTSEWCSAASLTAGVSGFYKFTSGSRGLSIVWARIALSAASPGFGGRRW